MSFFNQIKVLDSTGSLITDTNPFPVETPQLISTINTTTTPLGIGGVFPGAAEAINSYGIIFINVYSDVASATDGLKIYQSSDGTNWDHSDAYTVPAATGKNYSINPYAEYIKVEYTNGGTGQSVFRLQTIYKASGLDSSHRITDPIVSEDDARLVKSVITGEGDDGVYRNVRTSPAGNLLVTDNSSGLAIARGLVNGTKLVHKFGDAPDFDISDGDVTIWDAANDAQTWQNMLYNYSSTADIDRLSSSSASDTGDILVYGLDANYAEVEQTITLTGQTPVALSTPLLRVYRMENIGVANFVGNIFCFVNVTTTLGVPDTPANIRAVVYNGNNQTLMAVYPVPAGKKAYMRSWYASLSAKKTSIVTIKLFARSFGKVFQLKHLQDINSAGSSSIQHTYHDPVEFAEKTDIEMRATTATDGAGVAAGFDIVLVDD